MTVIYKFAKFAWLLWWDAWIKCYSSYFIVNIKSVYSYAFTFLFVFTLLVVMITHTKFTCKFISFWRNGLIFIIRISTLIIMLAMTTWFISPSASALKRIWFFIIFEILVVFGWIIRNILPSLTTIRIGILIKISILSLITLVSIRMEKFAGTLCKVLTVLSEFTLKWRSFWKAWVHLNNS